MAPSIATRTLARRIIATAALPLVFLGLDAARPAPVSHIAGTMSLKYTQQHMLPSGDQAAPVLFQSEAKGTNRNTGAYAYMDGAEVTIIEISDLTQGNGPQQGYITFSQNGERETSRYSGTVTTTLGPNHAPVTTVAGTWTKVAGTGRYAGATGSGRYSGRLVSPTNLVVDWEGEIALKDRTASR